MILLKQPLRERAPGPGLASGLLVCLLLAAGARAQDDAGPQARLRAALEPKEITVGDPVTVTLILEWPAGAPDVEPRFPAWQESWGDAEVLEAGEVTRRRDDAGNTVFTQQVRVTAFEPGEVKLTPLTIALPLGGETRETRTPDDLVFEVTSVLPEDAAETTAPRPPRGLETLPAGHRFWLTAAILSALVAFAAVLVARRHPEAFGGLLSPPRRPPLDELLASLAAVDPAAGSEPAHTRLSLALRTYLGRAAGVQAVEATTSEIHRQLARGALEPALAQRVMTLLRRCDEAKFIPGWEVPEPVVAERLREGEELARMIEHHLHPPEPEEDQPGAPETPTPTGGPRVALESGVRAVPGRAAR